MMGMGVGVGGRGRETVLGALLVSGRVLCGGQQRLFMRTWVRRGRRGKSRGAGGEGVRRGFKASEGRGRSRMGR